MRKSTSESRNRSVREAYRHVVKQASRRWRAGHHDSAAGGGEAPRNLICALKKTIAAGSPPAGACSASNTMSDVPSSLFNMRSRPDVSQFVRSTAETTAEWSAVGLLTLRAGAVRGARRCNAQARCSAHAMPANAARRTTLIGARCSAQALALALADPRPSPRTSGCTRMLAAPIYRRSALLTRQSRGGSGS